MPSRLFMPLLGGVFVALFAVFYVWQTPAVLHGRLSAQETEDYLARIDRQLVMPDEEKAQVMPRLRAFAENDDGQPIYMLNLMRYYDQVQRIPGAPTFDGTPQQANAHYEAAVTPMVVKLGGYPLVAGAPLGANVFNAVADLDHWGRVLVVRYPSRRAFFELVSDPAYAQIEPFKMMAQQVVIVPVSGDIVIPDLRWVVAGVLALLFLATGWWRAR